MSTQIERTFGQILRSLRQKRGLSQERLGFESGYHRTYISLLERGLKNPSLTTIFRLASALGVSPSEMVQLVEARVNQVPNRDPEARNENP